MVIDVDPFDPAAPPRRNGELVFDAPWQARAFGMAIALLERQRLGWNAFRRHLVPVIERKPAATYYEQFVDALAALAEEVAGEERPGPRSDTWF
jgi:hypothetical protein